MNCSTIEPSFKKENPLFPRRGGLCSEENNAQQEEEDVYNNQYKKKRCAVEEVPEVLVEEISFVVFTILSVSTQNQVVSLQF